MKNVTLTTKAQQMRAKHAPVHVEYSTPCLFTDSLLSEEYDYVEEKTQRAPIESIDITKWNGQYSLTIATDMELATALRKLSQHKNVIRKVVFNISNRTQRARLAELEKIEHFINALNDGRDIIQVECNVTVETKSAVTYKRFCRLTDGIEYLRNRADYWIAFFNLQDIMSTLSTSISTKAELEEYMLTYIANSGYDVSLSTYVDNAQDGLLYGITESDGRRVEWLRHSAKQYGRYEQTFADTVACFKQVLAYEKFLGGNYKDSLNVYSFTDDDVDEEYTAEWETECAQLKEDTRSRYHELAEHNRHPQILVKRW